MESRLLGITIYAAVLSRLDRDYAPKVKQAPQKNFKGTAKKCKSCSRFKSSWRECQNPLAQACSNYKKRKK